MARDWVHKVIALQVLMAIAGGLFATTVRSVFQVHVSILNAVVLRGISRLYR